MMLPDFGLPFTLTGWENNTEYERARANQRRMLSVKMLDVAFSTSCTLWKELCLLRSHAI